MSFTPDGTSSFLNLTPDLSTLLKPLFIIGSLHQHRPSHRTPPTSLPPMKRALRRLFETWRRSDKPNATAKRSQFSLKHVNNYFVNKFNHALGKTADFLQSLRTDNLEGQSADDGNSTPIASPRLTRRIQESLHLIPVTSLNDEIVTPPRQVMRKDRPPNYKAYMFRGEKSVPRKRKAQPDLTANTKRTKSFLSPAPHDLHVSEGYKICIPQRGAPMLEIRIPNYNASATGGDKSAPPKSNASRFPTPPANPSRKTPPHPPRPPMNDPTADYMFGIIKIPAVVPKERISKHRRRPIVSRGNRRQPPELNFKRFGKTTQQPLQTKRVLSPTTGALSFREMQDRRHEAQRGKVVQNWKVAEDRVSTRPAQQSRTSEGRIGCTEPDNFDWEAMWEARRTPPVCGKRKRSFSIVAYMEEPRPRRRKLGPGKHGL